MTFLQDLDELLIDLDWEVASRCTCWDPDSKQPDWNHADCKGTGVLYAPKQRVRAIFSGRSQWRSRRSSGEHGLGEAHLTSPLAVRPGYVDARVRDRFTVLAATSDADQGSVWLPAAKAVPFLWQGTQEAWRVQLQGLEDATRVKPTTA